MFVAVAAVGGAVVSGMFTSSAADSAADAQVQAADRSAQVQMDMYNQSRADMEPWRVTGENALNDLYGMVQAGPGEFTQDPGYQFRLDEGQKAIERSAAARGQLLSGSTIKATERYAQDYASNEYNNFLNRYYQSLTPYQSLAGVGMTSAGQIANIGQSTAAGVSQAYTNAGDARASGYINSANALGNAANQAAYGIGNYFYQPPAPSTYYPGSTTAVQSTINDWSTVPW